MSLTELLRAQFEEKSAFFVAEIAIRQLSCLPGSRLDGSRLDAFSLLVESLLPYIIFTN